DERLLAGAFVHGQEFRIHTAAAFPIKDAERIKPVLGHDHTKSKVVLSSAWRRYEVARSSRGRQRICVASADIGIPKERPKSIVRIEGRNGRETIITVEGHDIRSCLKTQVSPELVHGIVEAGIGRSPARQARKRGV